MTFGWDVESEIYELSLRGREMHSFAEDKTKAGRNDICGGGIEAEQEWRSFYKRSLGRILGKMYLGFYKLVLRDGKGRMYRQNFFDSSSL